MTFLENSASREESMQQRKSRTATALPCDTGSETSEEVQEKFRRRSEEVQKKFRRRSKEVQKKFRKRSEEVQRKF